MYSRAGSTIPIQVLNKTNMIHTTRNRFAIHSLSDLTSTPEKLGNSATSVNEHIYENLRSSEIDSYNGGSSESNSNYLTENIYENICEDCGRLYDSKCNFCFDDSSDLELFAATRKKPLSDYIPKIFRGIKVKRKLSRKDSQKKRQLDIVHQIENDTTLFRTNETFCMQEICQMRKNLSLLQQQSIEEHASETKTSSEFSFKKITDASVNFWLSQIMNHTENYEEIEQYFVKHIPSSTFNHLFYFNTYDCMRVSKAPNYSSSSSHVDWYNDDDDNMYERVRQFIASRQHIVNYCVNEEAKSLKPTAQINDDPDFAEEMEYKHISVADGLVTSLLNLLDTKLSSGYDGATLPSFLVKDDDKMTSFSDSVIAFCNEVQPLKRCSSTKFERRKKRKQQVSLSVEHETVISSASVFERVNQCLLSISLNTIILTYDNKDAKLFLQYHKTSESGDEQINSLLVIRRPKIRKPVPRPRAVSSSSQLLAERTVVDCSVVLRNKKGRGQINWSENRLLKRKDIFSLPINHDITGPIQENIYQPLWKCKSACHEDDTTIFYDNDTTIHDHDCWELADDFTAAFDLKDIVDGSRRINSSAGMANISEAPLSEPNIYSIVQILYSVNDPSINRIIFPASPSSVHNKNDTVISSHINRSNAIKRPSRERVEQLPLPIFNENNTHLFGKYFGSDAPDCVKAWIDDLKDPYWCEDEEDLVRIGNKLIV